MALVFSAPPLPGHRGGAGWLLRPRSGAAGDRRHVGRLGWRRLPGLAGAAQGRGWMRLWGLGKGFPLKSVPNSHWLMTLIEFFLKGLKPALANYMELSQKITSEGSNQSSLVLWNICYIENVIIPTDFHIFQMGGNQMKPPTSHWLID